MVVLIRLRMGVIVFEQFVEPSKGLFSLRPVGFVDDVERCELCVVVGFAAGIVTVLPAGLFVVERDECSDEVIGFGVWPVVVERDVGVMKTVIVVDALAAEDAADVRLVSEVGLCEIGWAHNSNFSGLDM